MASQYQIALMGHFAGDQAKLEQFLFAQIDDLGINRTQIAILAESEIGTASPNGPLVAVFFGYVGADDAAHPALASLLMDSITVIPCVDAIANVTASLPGASATSMPSGLKTVTPVTGV